MLELWFEAIEPSFGAVAVVDASRMHPRLQQVALHLCQYVSLAARNIFAAVVTARAADTKAFGRQKDDPELTLKLLTASESLCRLDVHKQP